MVATYSLKSWYQSRSKSSLTKPVRPYTVKTIPSVITLQLDEKEMVKRHYDKWYGEENGATLLGKCAYPLRRFAGWSFKMFA